MAQLAAASQRASEAQEQASDMSAALKKARDDGTQLASQLASANTSLAGVQAQLRHAQAQSMSVEQGKRAVVAESQRLNKRVAELEAVETRLRGEVDSMMVQLTVRPQVAACQVWQRHSQPVHHTCFVHLRLSVSVRATPSVTWQRCGDRLRRRLTPLLRPVQPSVLCATVRHRLLSR